ncbi:unnamed protein product [Ambrosiozyma monospora]|uniref:Unnamed protein product n=1 Tax=Ambrosiozyma monospora TaxID=43982 RepID=A0A9W6Z0U0_AMBMO|nr:unnamed protein product [Ambrosiozyma monospora]
MILRRHRGLTLNASKSEDYCTNVSMNTTLTGWEVQMAEIHSETFLYLGVPMNGLDWKEKVAKLLKKVPPLLYSAMYYFVDSESVVLKRSK